MLNKNSVLFVLIIYLCSPFIGVGETSYLTYDSSSKTVTLEGMFNPDDGTYINGDIDTIVELYQSDDTDPYYTTTIILPVWNNYFRYDLDLSDQLSESFLWEEYVSIKLILDDDLYVELPIASVPIVMKSHVSGQTVQFYDQDIFYVDYDNNFVGIGVTEPVVELDISGSMNVSVHYTGDGSQLTNLPYKGIRSDLYSSMESENGEFLIVTVNSVGDVLIGGYSDDEPNADLHVYGSLFVQDSDEFETEIVSGAGSRWMWYADRSVLRIGYTPSDYWDDNFSGDHSIAFGYGTMATGNYSIVTGGQNNFVRADYSVILGGLSNEIYDQDSVIFGGQSNIIYSQNSVILGGYSNRTNDSSIVLGGRFNLAYGTSNIVAGDTNSVDGNYSISIGGQKIRLWVINLLQLDQILQHLEIVYLLFLQVKRVLL